MTYRMHLERTAKTLKKYYAAFFCCLYVLIPLFYQVSNNAMIDNCQRQTQRFKLELLQATHFSGASWL
jgi:hypothetical protein